MKKNGTFFNVLDTSCKRFQFRVINLPPKIYVVNSFIKYLTFEQLHFHIIFQYDRNKCMRNEVFILKYNKLVRDKIPTIIEEDGKCCHFNVLDQETFREKLIEKFHEETIEFEETTNDDEAIEELADLLELIHAAATLHGQSIEEVERVRMAKKERRGGFEKKLLLIEVSDA